MHQTKNKAQDWHHFKNNTDFNVPHNEFVNYINTEKISIVLAKKKGHASQRVYPFVKKSSEKQQKQIWLALINLMVCNYVVN